MHARGVYWNPAVVLWFTLSIEYILDGERERERERERGEREREVERGRQAGGVYVVVSVQSRAANQSINQLDGRPPTADPGDASAGGHLIAGQSTLTRHRPKRQFTNAAF